MPANAGSWTELMRCAEDARTGFDKVFDGVLQGSMHQMPQVAARTSTKRSGAFGTAGRIYVMGFRNRVHAYQYA